MNKKQTFLIIPVILSTFTAALGANSNLNSGLNLNQAIKEAVSQSPLVQKAQAAFDESSWKKTEAFSTFLPSLNISANYFTNVQYQFVNVALSGNTVSIPGIYPTTQATATLSYPLFDGFQGYNNYSAADLQEDAALDNLEWVKFQIESEVKIKFAQALAAAQLQEAANQNVKTIEDHVGQIRAMKKNGVSTNYDLLRAEVQLNEAKTELLQASDNVILARQRLGLVLGMENDTRVLEGQLPIPKAEKIKDLVVPVQSARKDIKALEEKTRASEKMESAHSTFWSPHVSLAAQGTQYNNLNSSMTDWNSFRTAYSVGVFLNWNIFDGLVSYSKSQEAYYQKVQIEKSLKQAKLQVPYDFDFWKRRYNYSASLYEARKSDLEKSEESVRLARLSFKAGTRTITEVLDAQLELFRSRSGVINAMADSFEALTNIEMALGRRL